MNAEGLFKELYDLAEYSLDYWMGDHEEGKRHCREEARDLFNRIMKLGRQTSSSVEICEVLEVNGEVIIKLHDCVKEAG